MSAVNNSERSRVDLCPVCRKLATPEHMPFCSQGCRDRDLLNWLGEGYRIPGPSIDEESGD